MSSLRPLSNTEYGRDPIVNNGMQDCTFAADIRTHVAQKGREDGNGEKTGMETPEEEIQNGNKGKRQTER